MMENFKINASGAGKLMTNPRIKNETLSETAKSFLKEWLVWKIYGYRKEISSKQINKGIEYEDIAIDKAIEWLDLPFALKNKKRFEDEFFTGEPDIITDDCVIDIKNSWDCYTFPLFDDEIPTVEYMYQVQVYMHLTGLKKASVVYVLLNTPETYTTTEWTYDHLDKKYRIKKFDFEYNHEIIEELKKRVILAREYINNLTK